MNEFAISERWDLISVVSRVFSTQSTRYDIVRHPVLQINWWRLMAVGVSLVPVVLYLGYAREMMTGIASAQDFWFHLVFRIFLGL